MYEYKSATDKSEKNRVTYTINVIESSVECLNDSAMKPIDRRSESWIGEILSVGSYLIAASAVTRLTGILPFGRKRLETSLSAFIINVSKRLVLAQGSGLSHKGNRSHYILAISLPKILLTNHVNTMTMRFLQLRVHSTDPLLQANHADLPVHPSFSPLPAITPS